MSTLRAFVDFVRLVVSPPTIDVVQEGTGRFICTYRPSRADIIRWAWDSIRLTPAGDP